MAKLVKTKTTTTVTEEVELAPVPAGAEIGHRYFHRVQYCCLAAGEAEEKIFPAID